MIGSGASLRRMQFAGEMADDAEPNGRHTLGISRHLSGGADKHRGRPWSASLAGPRDRLEQGLLLERFVEHRDRRQCRERRVDFRRC